MWSMAFAEYLITRVGLFVKRIILWAKHEIEKSPALFYLFQNVKS